MKRFNYYLGLLLMLVFVTSCHEEFDQPPVYIPVAEAVPNMTIAQFKEKHWQDVANYVDTVTEDEVIHGWVTANDISNNIYKTVYITDGSASLSISISQNELYKKFRVGQEVVLPMKGHYVGKATGQMYVAAPYWYVSKNGSKTLECLNMSAKEMEELVQFNLMPDVSKIDTIEVNISDFQDKYDAETLRKYQGMLLRIKDVEFVDANGKNTYADIYGSSSATDRYVMDREGNRLLVRNSKSADFAANPLPLGRYDIVGVLGYYEISQGTWQFYLRTAEDVIGEGLKGTKSLPYSVVEAIDIKDTGENGWVSGYIVGAVAAEVTTVTSNADIEWKAPTELDNTIVIADDPNCKDYTKCIIVPLPVGSPFRADANLKTNTIAYKAPLKVKGEFVSFMGITGIKGNTGSRSEYVLDVAVTTLQEDFKDGIPETWTVITLTGSTVWKYYAYPAANPTTFCAEFYNSASSAIDAWLITPKLDIKKAKSKIFNFTSEVKSGSKKYIEVYILDNPDPSLATVKQKLNPILPTIPSSNYSEWVSSGDIDLSPWADGEYYIGFNYNADASNSSATWCIDDVTFGMGDPPLPENRADFETLADKVGESGTFTTTKGWTVTNCMLLQGGTIDNNPVFKFIGLIPGFTKTYAVAPTMNGNVNSVGKIVSPVIHGGMKKLTFDYGYAFNGKEIRFRVDVKQNGNVVKTWEVSQQNVTKYTKFTFENDVTVSGDFTIEFTNLSPSNATSDKDRLSIWNVEWEQ